MKVASHVLEGEIERLKRVVANRDETIERLTQQVTAMRAPAFLFPSEWDLSAVEAAILAGLISRKVASREYLLAESRMAATVRSRELPTVKVVDVFISRMRRKLAPLGFEITTHWANGYSLSDEARRTLSAYRQEQAQ